MCSKVMLKLDLHVHTKYSYDAYTEVGDALKIAKLKGLHGIAIVDHGSLKGALHALRLAKEILVIPGTEIYTNKGHLIGLGIEEPIPDKLTAAEASDRIREQGGITIIPHPYNLLLATRIIEETKPDAIEIINSRSFPFFLSTKLSKRLAMKIGVAGVAGSDAHLPEEIGYAYSEVSCKSYDIADILRSIKGGRVTPKGRAICFRYRFKKLWLNLRSSSHSSFNVNLPFFLVK